MMLRCVAAIACAGSTIAAAQDLSTRAYPNKAIRIVTAEPGGGNELAARLIAQGLTGLLGQQVIVESRGGGSGAITMQTVARASPDGYTLLVFSSALWVLPIMKDVPWDTFRDFTPVILAASAPNVLVVHPALPVKSVRDLIALAKGSPGKLDYATGVAGAAAHLSAELFKSMARVNIVRIPYKGTGPGLNALMGGEVQLMFPAAGAVASHVKAGRLRALAVTSARPSALAPGLPTMASAGLTGYEAVSIYGLFAPAKTPAAIVNLLNQETARVLGAAVTRERFYNAGVETVGSSPEEFTSIMKSDMNRWDKVIKDAGIHED
jgi:tripartite-type tricarboxylate transporter receptor subunit TctC